LYAGKQKRAIWNKAFSVVNSNTNLPKKDTSSGAFEQNCELYHLTTREKDIAKLICQGQKYKDIGETLFIAERTVKNPEKQQIYGAVLSLYISRLVRQVNKKGMLKCSLELMSSLLFISTTWIALLLLQEVTK